MALAKGTTAFGTMESAWRQFLVRSRFRRALSGTAKTVVFVYLALLTAAAVAWVDTPPAPYLPTLHTIAL